MFYVYVLQLGNRDLYIGYTTDLRRRILDHKAGTTKTTRGKKFCLIYYEAYACKQDATKREWRLKHYAKAKSDLIDAIDNSRQRDMAPSSRG